MKSTKPKFVVGWVFIAILVYLIPGFIRTTESFIANKRVEKVFNQRVAEREKYVKALENKLVDIENNFYNEEERRILTGYKKEGEKLIRIYRRDRLIAPDPDSVFNKDDAKNFYTPRMSSQ